MNDPETLARWLQRNEEFADRPGPYLSLGDDDDAWVVQDDNLALPSPRDLAKAIIEFIQNP